MTHIQIQPVDLSMLLSLFTLDAADGVWSGYAVTLGGALRQAQHAGFSLIGVNLAGADLRGEALGGLDLRYADLRGARLQHADLSGTQLSGALLQGADVSEAQLLAADTTQARAEHLALLLVVPGLYAALHAACARGDAGAGGCWVATLTHGAALLQAWLRH